MKERKIIDSYNKTPFFSYLKQIWKFRYFSFSIGFGELKNKHAKTYTGIFMSFIQTLITLCIYWFVFGIIIKVKTGSIPYPLFVLSGLILWQYFSNTVNTITWALISSENLISKLYFPRINIIFSKMIPGTIDFLIGSCIFIILFILYSQPLSLSLLLVPFVLMILIINTLSIGLWTSIISLYYNDLSHILVQLITFFIFITPVFYPSTIIPEQYKILLYINPIAGTIELFRSLFFNYSFEQGYITGFFISGLLFISALYFHKKIDKKITDLL